ncbi:unnamed protein product [Durusdinium trenchii]|uniref:Uncharacterized protein n=3 Tax=Durusdinium trenchii TaxID=1381693 RepID=A0ABP0M310_9DINO
MLSVVMWAPTELCSSLFVSILYLRATYKGMDKGAPDDYDADADDDPAAEETRAEKEEVLNETLGKAKQVLDVMKRVDIETDASKAQLVEIGAKAIDFKARFRFRNAAAAANTAQEIASHPGEVNQLLSKLSEDAQELQDLMNFTKVGKPFRFRQHLIKLAGDAERASQLMGVKLDKLAEALRMMKHAGGEYVDLTDGEGEVEAPTPAPEDAVQQGGQQHQMDEYGGQEQLGMVGPQAGALHGMPGDVSNPDMAQNAQQMVLEEKMQAAEEAAMSGVTATKEDEQASAEEMESAMEDATWSVDVLPQPQPSDVEPQEPAPAGVPPLPVSETSSGCACDATAKCALQGQPFTWCRIGAEEEPTCSKLEAAQDPTGRNHALGVQGRMWDYCVPPASEAAGHEADANQQQVQQPEKEQTTHVGCECAPRPDVLEKYMEDPLFHNMETGDIDLEKVPFKDRITVEAMQKYLQEGGDLCQQTPSSGQFLACPAAKDCAGSNVAGPGGALPSGWFSGVSGKSWDFCAPARSVA